MAQRDTVVVVDFAADQNSLNLERWQASHPARHGHRSQHDESQTQDHGGHVHQLDVNR